jgi:hypothetical protein
MPLFGERRRQYDREWTARRRAAYFEDKSCVKCGSKENLELDHINPAEKEDHRIWNWSEERRNIELAKCQVLCHDCHLEKSILYFKELYTIDDPTLWKHGTNNTYNKHGCRCSLCRAWRVSKFKRLGT